MALRFVVTLFLLFCPSVFEAREIKHRIALKPSQTETVIAGGVPKPDDVVIYALPAQAGQHIFIRLEPDKKLVAQTVLVPPSGKQLGPGAKLDFVADEPGIFQIRVIPRERSSGTFRLYLSVR
jgi:hypothetical protein